MNTIKAPNVAYGQTISFRYFADKRLKAQTYFQQGNRFETYPLYIEIKTKRQTSQRKSALSAYVAPELLEQFLRDNADAIAMEVNALRDYILAQRPFDNTNFSLSKSLSGYSAVQEHMPYLIGELLRQDYQKAREADAIALMELDRLYHIPELLSPNWDIDLEEQDNILRSEAGDVFYRGGVEDIHPVAIFREVRDLAISDKPHVRALFERYGKYFWGLDRYCRFMSENTRFKLVSTGIFLSQDFKEMFVECFTKPIQPIVTGKEVYDSIYDGLKQLKMDKPGDKRLISVRL